MCFWKYEYKFSTQIIYLLGFIVNLNIILNHLLFVGVFCDTNDFTGLFQYSFILAVTIIARHQVQ